jgi:hypothetical protein
MDRRLTSVGSVTPIGVATLIPVGLPAVICSILAADLLAGARSGSLRPLSPRLKQSTMLRLRPLRKLSTCAVCSVSSAKPRAVRQRPPSTLVTSGSLVILRLISIRHRLPSIAITRVPLRWQRTRSFMHRRSIFAFSGILFGSVFREVTSISPMFERVISWQISLPSRCRRRSLQHCGRL